MYRKIEQTETKIQIECDFCDRKFPVEDYDKHQVYFHENLNLFFTFLFIKEYLFIKPEKYF